MRTHFGTVLAAGCGIGGAALLSLPLTARADEAPVYETPAPIVYSIDSTGSPRHVKSFEGRDALWPAKRRAGEKVTLVSPGGSRTTLAAADSTVTNVEFKSSLNAGGVWTLENSVQGKSVFTMRHSLYGTQGSGTAEDPARIVDGDELVDYGAGSGYVFALADIDSLMDELVVPPGLCLGKAGETTWRVVTSEGGCIFAGTEIVYRADSRETGPDRKTTRRTALPVAYTGDAWVRDRTKNARLSFTPPGSASPSNVSFKGTGAYPFVFNKVGDWNVRLTMADGTTLTSTVTVIYESLLLYFK